MENATKALLIAGGVLIGIIIMSLAVYLFSNMSNVSRQYYSEQDRREIAMFNNRFEKYANKDQMFTLFDMKTIFNLVDECKEKYGIKVELKVKNGNISDSNIDNEIETAISDSKVEANNNVTNSTRTYKYKFNSIEYDVNGYVKSLTFEKIK